VQPENGYQARFVYPVVFVGLAPVQKGQEKENTRALSEYFELFSCAGTSQLF
jgi:hypothetical protein